MPLTDLSVLTRLIESEATALGFALVRVRLFGGADDLTLQVMAERPETRQLTIDDCAALSRRVSDVLDALESQGDDPIESEYRLEVSSPGIDRPLTRVQDYTDWVGHEARIKLKAPIEGRKQLTGDLAGWDQGYILIDVRGHKRMAVEPADIADAKLTLTDRLIAATQPLSADGAEDVEILSADADAEETETEDTH